VEVSGTRHETPNHCSQGQVFLKRPIARVSRRRSALLRRQAHAEPDLQRLDPVRRAERSAHRLGRQEAAAASGLAFALLWRLVSDLVELGLRLNRLGSGLPSASWTSWWAARIVATATLAIAGFLAAPILYALIAASPRRWPIWGAALVSLFAYAFIAISPLLAHEPPLPNGPLKSAIGQMLRSAGRPDVPVRLHLNSGPCVGGANVGAFPTTRIVLDDGYLAYPTRQGVEATAHELGHYIRDDADLGLAIGVVWIFAMFAAMSLGGVALVHWLGPRLGADSLAKPASLPVLVFMAVLTYEAGLPLFNFIQRQVEHRADAFAMQITHDGAAGAVQMVRDTRCDDRDPSPDWLAFTFFWNHPSIAERIRFMNGFSAPPRSP
jgi:Zn-dependent protease with chaperone function